MNKNGSERRELMLVFVGDGDAAEAACGVDIDSVFAFFGSVFALVGKAAENETGF